MRIISDFTDYYDCIQRQVFDKEIVYLRKTREIINNNRPYHYRISTIKIGFCGKIYLGFHTCLNGLDSEYFYDVESLNNYVNHWYTNVQPDKDFLLSWNCSGGFNWKYRYDYGINNIKTAKEKFNNHKQDNNLLSKFIEFQSPVFVLADFNYTINPCLKDYNFYKVFNTFLAFQEIYMYISGVLGNNNKPIPEIKDIDMVEIKGFDKKTSFRKEKSNKER